MIVEAQAPDGGRETIEVDVVLIGHRRSAITIRIGTEPLYLDENHATALMQALQAAITEVQARAVSL